MTREVLLSKARVKREISRRKAPDSFVDYVCYVMPDLNFTSFHITYYQVLHLFAIGVIKRLIITIPPQHGKSLGASILLPSYILGLNPNSKIAIASYSAMLANKFNKRIQRIIDSSSYEAVFPQTSIKSSRGKKNTDVIRTADHVEVIDFQGELMSVGREGSLTGNKVDVFILDDLYKDAMEANSPTVRENCWEWYMSVARTRQHNDSRELIVFTRWHEDDLIGRLESAGEVRTIERLADIDPGHKGFYKLNFDAIKAGSPTEIDPRKEGEPLWPAHHSSETLKERKKLDPHSFECMYQGRPASKEGLLYGESFNTYTELPKDIMKYANYTDTADMGDDKLCSVCYQVGRDGKIYVTDVLYTSEPMEVTEGATAQMLGRNNTRIAYVESNNGGRGFSRVVSRLMPNIRIEWFHQSANKEARIISNSATVSQNILMPADWRLRWPEFYTDLVTYKRIFRANRHDDAPDVLTGIVEKERINHKSITKIGFST